VTASPAAWPGSGLRLLARRGGLALGAIFGPILGALVLGVGLLGLDRLPVSLCVFKALTGWPCLSCGFTRVLARLFHLDLAGALALNPLAAVGVVTALAWGLADIVLLARGRALALELSPPAGRVLRWGMPAAILLNWAYLLAAGR
jgi:hypothetical protein